MVSQYPKAGIVTDRVTIRDLQFPQWDIHFIEPPRIILHSPVESLLSAHLDLVHLLQNRLRRISDTFTLPLDYISDTWDFILKKESLYGPTLDDVYLDGCKGSLVVLYDALQFKIPLLPVDFKSLRGARMHLSCVCQVRSHGPFTYRFLIP